MHQGPKKKSGLLIFILILLALSASRLLAAEYNHIYHFEAPKIISHSNGRQLLDLEGTRQKDDIVGAPILPVKTLKLFIPAQEDVVSIDIDYGALITIDGSYLIQHAATPYPLSFNGPIAADMPAGDIYESNAFYPSNVFRNRGQQYFHGVQLVLLDLMPVLYNPFEGQVKYYENLHVKIRTAQRKNLAQVMSFKPSLKKRNSILRAIENKDDFLVHHPVSDPIKSTMALSMAEAPFSEEDTRQYVVITTRDLASAFETLTNHRASSEGGGYTVHIEYIDNIDATYHGVDLAEKMRNFIKDMYTHYGTEYVLLGGDSDGSSEYQTIPTRRCYAQAGAFTDNSIPSDLYFGCLDGSWNEDGDAFWGEPNDGIDGGDIDWFSEVYVGRIPADDPIEATNQINKIIAFETSYRAAKTLLVGEALEDSTWGGDRMDWVYSFMDATPKTELYDRDWGANNWPSSQLLSYINSNKYYWINNLGHSTVVYNMGLDYDDIVSMANNKFMFIYAQGCYSGSIDSLNSDGTYESADCFGEVITNGYADRGAFAFLGNSRYSWYTPGSYVEGASNRAHKEFVETVFAGNITKLGQANQISKTHLPLASGLYRWIAFETNLLGCPASDLDAPHVLDSDCNDCESTNESNDSSDGSGDGSGGGGGGCFIETLGY
jgi:Peptidase family C25/Propeptide_C25